MDPAAETPEPNEAYLIELSNGATAIREIYYANGKGKVFTYPLTRNAIRLFTLGVVSSFIFGLASSSNQIGYVVCLVVSLVFTLYYMAIALSRTVKYFEWKYGVEAYLQELDKKGDQQLKLNSYAFELSNKKETVIEKWSNLSKVSITLDAISLGGADGTKYLFPAKTMNPSDYQLLQDIVRQRMQVT